MRMLITLVALVASISLAYAQEKSVAPPKGKVIDKSACDPVNIDTAQVADAEFVTVRVQRPAAGFGAIPGFDVEARMSQSLARKDSAGFIVGLWTCKDEEAKETVRIRAKLVATEDGQHAVQIVLPNPNREKDFRIRSCSKTSDTSYTCWRATYTGDRIITLLPE